MEADDIKRKLHDLAQSMERVRSRQADRDDVVVDLHHARLSRLEILAENLKPVFEAVADDNDQFEFAMVKGETPRLWIDMTSFIRMAGDGREYEFVKDTRMGRTILGRESNPEKIGEQVSDYIAERILERERMIEGEWVSLKTKDKAIEPEEENSEVIETSNLTENQTRHTKLKLSLWFLVGMIVGGGFIMSMVWFGQFDKIITWVSGISA